MTPAAILVPDLACPPDPTPALNPISTERNGAPPSNPQAKDETP